MTIVSRSEPEGGRDIVNAALSARSQRSHIMKMLSGAPQTGAPLPVYVLDRETAASDDPLAHAKQAGWQYPIVGGETQGLASLAEGPKGLEFSGITHGTLPQRVLEAATLAERTLGPLPEQFQVRLLEIPSLLTLCLWFAGPTNRFISLLDGSPPGTAPLRVEDDIRARLRNALGAVQRAPGFGETPTN